MPIWSEASLGPYAWEYKLPKPVKRMKLMDDGYRNLGNPQSLPLEDSPAVENELASSVVSKGFVFQDSYLQHDDLAKLPRSMDMFRKIELDPYISLQLPSPGATAGRVLRHSASLFEDLLKKTSQWPLNLALHMMHAYDGITVVGVTNTPKTNLRKWWWFLPLPTHMDRLSWKLLWLTVLVVSRLHSNTFLANVSECLNADTDSAMSIRLAWNVCNWKF